MKPKNILIEMVGEENAIKWIDMVKAMTEVNENTVEEVIVVGEAN